MFTDLYFAVFITTPVFCILGLGILFKRIDWVTTDESTRIGSDLVFKVTLPCLLFVKLVATTISLPPLLPPLRSAPFSRQAWEFFCCAAFS